MNTAVKLDGDARCQLRLPIVPHHLVRTSPNEMAQINSLAKEIRAEDSRLCRVPHLAANLESGLLDAPALLIEDHSGIQLAHERGADTSLSYRALLLAGEGDLLAVYADRIPAFETYCRDRLALGRVEVIAPPLADRDQSLASACLGDRRLIERAVQRARESGGLNVIPYMATGPIWRLAGEIAGQAGVPVRVAGPPPALMRAVNNKLWFARWAAKLLGRDAVPQSRAVYGMAALVGHLRYYMRQHGRVAIKLSHSAASFGNLVLDSALFADLAAAEMFAELAKMFAQRGWKSQFPVQVTAWEGPISATPSAQVWIPLRQDGPPIIEGVFDQIVIDANARFAGGIPSDLSEPVQARVADEASRLGLLFQALGYFGRCSFDAVLVEGSRRAAQLHWVECNGRWGGVSIPMTLSNRLLGDWTRREMLIIEQRLEGMQSLSVEDFLTSCEPELFANGAPGTGVVLLSPGKLSSGEYDLLVLGLDRDDVLARRQALVARLARR